MRAFLLCALFAMAATVSCAEISAACNTTSAAVDVPSVKDAEKAIVRSGCEKINFKDPNMDTTCPFNEALDRFVCNCTTILSNTTAFTNAVTNSSGKACFYDLTFQLYGKDNSNKSVELWAAQYKANVFAVGKDCNEDDIIEKYFKGIAANATQQFVNSGINDISSITWINGKVNVMADFCGSYNSELISIPPRTNTPSSTSTSSSTGINPSSTGPDPSSTGINPSSTGPDPSSTGINPSSTGTNNNGTTPTGTNNNGTTPTPPTGNNNTTPAPTTPTPNPQGGDASSIASSVVLVASLIAATVTVVA